MGLNGLKQLGDQQMGRVGVNGSVDVDGTRYGARKGETWCDQFWTWLAIEASEGDGFTDINPDNVPAYFRDPKRDVCGKFFMKIKSNESLERIVNFLMTGEVIGEKCSMIQSKGTQKIWSFRLLAFMASHHIFS